MLLILFVASTGMFQMPSTRYSNTLWMVFEIADCYLLRHTSDKGRYAMMKTIK